jgi:hypothetical protein
MRLQQEVRKSMLYEVSCKWKTGPFYNQTFSSFVGSPMGAFVKPIVDKFSNVTGQKCRVIHDLSWPPDYSVNSFIAPELCSVQYVTIDDAVRMVKQCGRGCLMGKLDLKDAYK